MSYKPNLFIVKEHWKYQEIVNSEGMITVKLKTSVKSLFLLKDYFLCLSLWNISSSFSSKLSQAGCTLDVLFFYNYDSNYRSTDKSDIRFKMLQKNKTQL